MDATYGAGERLTGIGVYSRRILDGLAASQPDQEFVHFVRSQRWMKARRRALASNVRRRLLLDDGPVAQWLGRDVELFHGLNQRMPRTSFRRRISTFHDLFVLTAEYSTPEFRARFTSQAREAAERSDLMICVSAFTAGQVEDLLGVERARLRVIAHGTDFPAEVTPISEREPVILHVGAIQERKNVWGLLEAFEQAGLDGWTLVMAGGDGFGAARIREYAARSVMRERIRLLGYVDDGELARWYQRASILAFPSLDEGFGIPVLEAMANGLPVVASDRSAIPEVAGGAALLVDPVKDGALAAALREMAGSAERRMAWSVAGRQRAREMSWETAVERTWGVYRELLG